MNYQSLSTVFIDTLQHECGGITLDAAELTWVAGTAKIFSVAFDGVSAVDRHIAIKALIEMREAATSQFAPGEIIRMFDELLDGLSNPGWATAD